MSGRIYTSPSEHSELAALIYTQAASLHIRDCETRNVKPYLQSLDKFAEMAQVAATRYADALGRMEKPQ
jgi:hypothetical protein